MKKILFLNIYILFSAIFNVTYASSGILKQNDTVDVPKKLTKILALGNSFSQDAVDQNLYELAKSEGLEILIGNLNIGGCSLDRHWNNISNDVAEYAYLKIENGNKTNTSGNRISVIIKEEDWDYISIQQVSGYSGVFSSYANLPKIMNYLRENATNPNVKFILHQTWAYAETSHHGDFPKYDNNQMKMYKAIVKTAKQAAKAGNIDIIIPSGTAIQNGRTSYIGDNFDRDGFHLQLTYGRYTVACTWFEKIFGVDVRNNSFIPTGVDESEANVARAAAHFAVKKPYKITKLAKFKENSAVKQESQTNKTINEILIFTHNFDFAIIRHVFPV